MKNFLLGLLSGAVLLPVILGLYLRLGLAEVRGDLPPSTLETRFMKAAVHASVRRRAPETPNPVPPTDENLIAGGKLYLAGCSGCHGSSRTQEDSGDSLFPPVPQLPRAGTEYTEAQIFWVAKHGIRRTGMFANGKWNSDRELWTMAAFLKRIRELPPAVRQALEEKPSGSGK